MFFSLQSELHTLKRTITQDKVATENAFEARDAAQLEMREIQQELKMTKEEMEREWSTLSASMEASMLSMESDPFATGGGESPSQRARRAKSQKGSGADKSGGTAKKLSKVQKLALMQEDWDRIKSATGMSTAEEMVAFYKTAEDQVSFETKSLPGQ